MDVEKRLRLIAARLATQLDVLELQSKIQSQVKENIDKSQRRYYLQEQMKAIRKELGDGEGGGGSEADTLREKLVAANIPELVMKEANRELTRLESIPDCQPGVWRHSHVPADRQRAAVGNRDHRQDRSDRGAAGPRPRPLRPGEGQTPDHRIPGRPQAQARGGRGDPLLRRSARRG